MGPWLAVLAAVCSQHFALALEGSVVANVRTEYVDNALATERDELTELTHAPGLSVGATHGQGPIDVELQYSAERRFNTRDTTEDDTVLQGQGSLNWQVWREFIRAFAQNSRTETTISSQGADVQSNRQVLSTTDIGLSASVPLPGSMFFQLTGLHNESSADETGNDSETQSVSGSLVVPWGGHRRISITRSELQTDFDLAGSTDYDSSVTSIELATDGRGSLDYAISFGRNSIDRDDREPVEGNVGSIDASYQLSPSAQVTIALGRSFRHETSAVFDGFDDFDGDILRTSNLGEVFTEDSVGLSFSSESGRFTYTASFDFNEQDYDAMVLDEKQRRYTLGVGMTLSRTSSLDFFVSASKLEFTGLGRNDELASTGLRYRISRWRRLAIDTEARWERRTSNVPLGGFVRRSAMINLTYHIAGRQAAALGR